MRSIESENTCCGQPAGEDAGEVAEGAERGAPVSADSDHTPRAKESTIVVPLQDKRLRRLHRQFLDAAEQSSCLCFAAATDRNDTEWSDE